MRNLIRLPRLITFLIATVWLVNGLFCKVMNLVPRHGEIVDAILPWENTRWITILIGVAEIAMAIWVVSRYRSRMNTILQILIVGVMNVLEFLLVPELLLWGRMNSLFALLFIIIVWYNEYVLYEKTG